MEESTEHYFQPDPLTRCVFGWGDTVGQRVGQHERVCYWKRDQAQHCEKV